MFRDCRVTWVHSSDGCFCVDRVLECATCSELLHICGVIISSIKIRQFELTGLYHNCWENTIVEWAIYSLIVWCV